MLLPLFLALTCERVQGMDKPHVLRLTFCLVWITSLSLNSNFLPDAFLSILHVLLLSISTASFFLLYVVLNIKVTTLHCITAPNNRNCFCVGNLILLPWIILENSLTKQFFAFTHSFGELVAIRRSYTLTYSVIYTVRFIWCYLNKLHRLHRSRMIIV